MEGIPNEILDKIIGFLDRDSLLAVRLLNKTWKEYAENYIMERIYLYLRKDKDILDLLSITSWRNSENALGIPFVRFHIASDFDEVQLRELLSLEMLETFTKKYGVIIQSLKIEWTTGYNKIFPLLMNTPNIEEIYFLKEVLHTTPIPYELNFPYLKIVKFEDLDLELAELILNASPGIQIIDLGEPYPNDISEDYISLLRSIASRDIEVKLEIKIPCLKYEIHLQHFIELTKIPLKVSEANISFEAINLNICGLGHLQQSIEEFIYRHSRTLKHLSLDCQITGDRFKAEPEKVLVLDLKNLNRLQKLELCAASFHGTLKVKLGLAPLLKELSITTGSYLNEPLLIDPATQLEKLCLYFYEDTLTKAEAEVRVQCLQKFLNSQAKNLRILEITATNSTGMDTLQPQKMENLQSLTLELEGFEETEASATEIFNDSAPNSGDITVLQELKLGEAELDDVKAVADLVSCGKIANLKYFEAKLSSKDDIKMVPPLLKIFESNNIKTKIYSSPY